ncbi:uncharacterized protein LOC122317666 [Carya illinoinensis]|uniref:uncharacterized protein LOC122317666 n=1 Tax=Carya illinoinensis TaxID=32201 RepID=UPI001C72803C|nr:uncharacterized protein LOC122317666 [Carya illinoinensis]
MAEDITARWKSLKLTEEEQQEIVLSEEAVLSSNAKGELCLLAKIFNDRTANREAFRTTMSKIWNTEGWLTFKDLETNVYLIEFQLVSDKEKVLLGRPWSFDRHLVCMKEFEGLLSLSEVRFDSEPFWIQVHNLPFAGMSKEMGILVGSVIGRVLEVETNTEGYGWGGYLRIKAEVNVTKALVRGRFLKSGSKQSWLSFKYERLPMFCFKCGRFVHEQGSCQERGADNHTFDQYGQWLRATHLHSKFQHNRRYGGLKEKEPSGSTWSGSQEEGDDYSGFCGVSTSKPGSEPPNLVESTEALEVNLGHTEGNLPKEDQGTSVTDNPAHDKGHKTFPTHERPASWQERLSQDPTTLHPQVLFPHSLASSYDVVMLATEAPGPTSIRKENGGVPFTETCFENLENSSNSPVKGKTWKRKARALPTPLSDVTNIIQQPSSYNNSKRSLRQRFSTRADGKCKKQKTQAPFESVQELHLLVKAKQPHLVFLTETKCNNVRLDRIKLALGYENCFSVNSKGKSGELALLWKDSVKVEVINYTTWHISALITSPIDNTQWQLTGFYGHPNSAKRPESWHLLRGLKPTGNLPWLCLGDFNEITHQSEKVGAANRPYRQMVQFRNSLSFCKLYDLGFHGDKFTWSNNREGDQFTKERLDRACGNNFWIKLFANHTVSHLDCTQSDHKALLVQTADLNSMGKKGRVFRFESAWTKEMECEEIIKKVWRLSSGPSILHRTLQDLNQCQGKLKIWSRNKQRDQRKALKNKTELLKILQERNQGELSEEIKKVNQSINCIMDAENLKRQQRAKQAWLKNGDRNTKFFHQCSSQRKRTNSILRIQTKSGLSTQDPQTICQTLLEFFTDLFTSSHPSGIDNCLSPLQKIITDDMFTFLSAVFTEIEVKEAVFSMNPLGSPGPDGFPALFFQKYWDTVGSNVTKASLEVLNGGKWNNTLNETLIALIPKKHNPSLVTDFRPISLCNVLYKIIAKTLANRLKKILPAIISPTQAAFVPGRLITDNIIVAFEALHTMKARLKGSEGYMALKLDMSKAYDRIEWAFLRSVMLKMGFPVKWIELVMKCVSAVSYSLIVNGEPQPLFWPTRGLRQGDPISPYLFILCSEALSCLLNHAEKTHLITGLPIRKNHLHINHLFFADDSLLFCKANSIEWSQLHSLLASYERASGQRLNKDKTSIFFSSNTREQTKEIVTSIAGIRGTSSYEKYLGLPALVGRGRYQSFKGILDRVQTKLNSWKTKLLSQAGKETLIKAVIQAIPTYSMGIFKLPRQLLIELNKQVRGFWWGQQEKEHKIHWVSWKQMIKSKRSGGFGMRDFEFFNRALLAKQGWRIISSPSSLAARVFKEKYFKCSTFLDVKKGSNSSFLWQSFISARSLLKEGLVWRVGDGQSIELWNDKWFPQPTSYKPQSSIRFLPADTKVAMLIDKTTNQWNYQLVEAVLDSTDAECVKRIPLSPYPTPDKLLWRGTSTGVFTVKSAYFLLLELEKQKQGQSSVAVEEDTVWSSIWQLGVPMATKNFLWRACLEAIPTRARLLHKSVVDEDSCPICRIHPETALHALWECPSAQDVWSQCNRRIQKASFPCHLFKSLLEACLKTFDEEELVEFGLTAWKIWKRRNEVVFSNTLSHPSSINQSVKLLITDLDQAHQPARQCSPPSSVLLAWEAPPQEKLKTNWDAGLDKASCKVGVGAVVRNWEGKVLATMRMNHSLYPDPFLAEAYAAHQAALFLKSMGWRDVIMEGDSLQVVNYLNSKEAADSYAGVLIKATRVTLDSFAVWTANHVKRTCNSVAHALCQDALSISDSITTVDVIPFCIRHLLL